MNKYLIGILTVVVLASSIYLILPQEVKISVGSSSTTLSIWNETSGKWYVGAVEYSKLFNGTKQISFSRSLSFSNNSANFTNITRVSTYKDIVLVDNYVFNGNIADKELFPIAETHEIKNGKGLIYQYEVQKLAYENIDLEGKNSVQLGKIKIVWDDRNYYAKLTNTSTGGKLVLKYRIASDDETYNIRIFDPVPLITKGNALANIQVQLANETADYSLLKNPEKLEDKRIYTPSVLTEGHLPIILKYGGSKLPNSLTVSGSNLQKLLNKTNREWKGDLSRLKDVSYWIVQNESYSYSRQIQNGTNIIVSEYPYGANLTTPTGCLQINSSFYSCSQTNPTYNTIILYDWKYVWKDISSISSLTLKKNEYYFVDIKANIKAGVETFGVDIEPSFTIGGYTFKVPEMAWWNSSYSFKKQINITAASTLPAGYTVNLTWDMTQANILNTGNDTRVVIDDGTNTLELDRNITSNGTANSLLEFKLNSPIAGGASNTSYYIYYGYSAAGNPPNNRSKIYGIFDGFEEYTTGSTNAAIPNWKMNTTGGTINITTDVSHGGTKSMKLSTGGGVREIFANNKTGFSNFTMEVWSYLPQSTGGTGPAFNIINSTTTIQNGCYNHFGTDNYFYLDCYSAGARTANYTTPAARTVNQWYNITVRVIGTKNEMWADGLYNTIFTSPSGWAAGDKGVGGYVFSPGGTVYGYFDDFLVRIWVENPPTITIGAEEIFNNPPQWSNNQSSIGALNALSNFNATWTDDSDANGYNFSFTEIGFLNGTLKNYTSIRFPLNVSHLNITSANYIMNFTIYANDSSNAWNKTNTVGISYFLLNDLGQDRKYEYGTKANISWIGSGTYCIMTDLYNEGNLTCGASPLIYNYTVGAYWEKKFNIPEKVSFNDGFDSGNCYDSNFNASYVIDLTPYNCGNPSGSKISFSDSSTASQIRLRDSYKRPIGNNFTTIESRVEYSGGGLSITQTNHYKLKLQDISDSTKYYAMFLWANATNTVIDFKNSTNTFASLSTGGCNQLIVTQQPFWNNITINSTHIRAKTNVCGGNLDTGWIANSQITEFYPTLLNMSYGGGIVAVLVNDFRITEYDTNNKNIYNISFIKTDKNIQLNLSQSRNLTNSKINITGFNTGGSYPFNSWIDVLSDGVKDLIFPGYLVGNILNQTYLSSGLSSEKYPFVAAGSVIRYINYTTSTSYSSFYNLTMSLWGDLGNTEILDFADSLINSSKINLTATNTTYNYWVYDDYSQENITASARWALTKTGDDVTYRVNNIGNFTPEATSLFYNNTIKSAVVLITNVSSNCVDGTETGNGKVRFTDIDMKNYNSWLINISYKPSSFVTQPCTTSSGKSTFIIYAGIYNGNSYYQLTPTYTHYTDESNYEYGKAKKWKINISNNIFYSYVDELYANQLTIDATKNYSAFLYSYVEQGEATSGTGTKQKILVSSLDMINASGVGMNYTGSVLNYTSSRIESNNIFNFTGTLLSAKLTADEIKPAGTAIQYYLSANNGTNWEATTSGNILSFANTGRWLKWKAEIYNTSAVNDTARIRSLNIMVSSGNATNVSIDIGADGTTEWNYPTQLNSSVSPQTVQLSNNTIVNYISSNCVSTLTCLVPIKITTASSGTLNITNMSGKISLQDINLLYRNSTLINNHLANNNLTNITFGMTNGTVEVKDLVFTYPKDFNITITAFNILNKLDNITRTIMARYSQYNLTYPTSYQKIGGFKIRTNNDTNLTPFGQSDNVPIWNITASRFNADPFNLAVKLNEAPNSCLNFKANNVSYAGNATNLSTIYKFIQNNTGVGVSKPIFWWLDLSNCGAGMIPLTNYTLRSYCSDCVYWNY